MLRPIFTSLLILSLSGCMLTRVTQASHQKEVAKFDVIGLTMEAAKAQAVQRGFDCDPGEQFRNVSSVADGTVRKADIFTCSKSSAELVCPQRRYVSFTADAKTGLVYAVGGRITEHSCF